MNEPSMLSQIGGILFVFALVFALTLIGEGVHRIVVARKARHRATRLPAPMQAARHFREVA